MRSWGRGALPARNKAFLTPLTVDSERGGSIEEDVGDADRDCLGDARSGVVQDGEEDGIALAAPGGAVGSGEDGVDLVAGEVAEDGLVNALGRNRENALCDGKCGGISEGSVAKKGADRGEAEIAGTGAVAPFLLQVVEKREHGRGIEVLNRQSGGGAPDAPLHEAEEDLEGVAVAGDRLRAGAALGDHPLVEKVPEQGGKGELGGRHWALSWLRHANCSNRCDVTAISSGTAERYQ
jgi:hypothetical protein